MEKESKEIVESKTRGRYPGSQAEQQAKFEAAQKTKFEAEHGIFYGDQGERIKPTVLNKEQQQRKEKFAAEKAAKIAIEQEKSRAAEEKKRQNQEASEAFEKGERERISNIRTEDKAFGAAVKGFLEGMAANEASKKEAEKLAYQIWLAEQYSAIKKAAAKQAANDKAAAAKPAASDEDDVIERQKKTYKKLGIYGTFLD
jgi:colicin import membrane protein